ncbi:MAG: hypothetical protein Q8941_24480 [Bacteroidota bacterium]|nr:hypothetical protein [Bacteroidota bacterium]
MNFRLISIRSNKGKHLPITLPFDPNDFIIAVENVVTNSFQSKILGFAEARLNDGKRLLAFNDLFIGASSHVSRIQTDLNAGLINNKLGLTIESLMPINGVIFSDGIESDFISFNSGSI